MTWVNSEIYNIAARAANVSMKLDHERYCINNEWVAGGELSRSPAIGRI